METAEMENGAAAESTKMEQQTTRRGRKQGGFITMPFVIANEALEKVATYGMTPNMILYLMGDYHIGIAQGTNILFFWSAATNFLPVVGAFVSDSYLGRYLTIGLGSISSLLGMVILWLTAMIPQARPSPCNIYKEKCKPPSSSQFAALLASFAFMSIGAGGIRPCSLAFGADQLDKRGDLNHEKNRALERFFSWYYAVTAVGVLIAFTGIVYIQDHEGWKIGFGVPASLMFLSALFFFLATPFYIKHKATSSLFTSLIQVAVVAYKNRKLAFPSEDSNLGYHQKTGSTVSEPTKNLRFLNKACIIRNPEDMTLDGVGSNGWNLCTVDQVEELKALIRVMPLWSSSIMMSINISQGSFGIIQARAMDRHITRGFEFPAASFAMFTIGGAIIWIVLYDRVLVPLASKIKGKPVQLGLKTRMGLGLFCSFLAMVVAGIVEHVRRRKAIASGFLDNPTAIVAMSAMWIGPQHILNGMAEAFNAVASNEFFYAELPKSMSSIASSLTGLALAVGSLLASFILSTVDNITAKGGRYSWLSNNINRGHYESYYWLLAVMSSFNLVYFLFCSWAYGPCSNEGMFKIRDGGKDSKEEELPVLGNGDRKEGERSKEKEFHLIVGNGHGKEGEELSVLGNGYRRKEGEYLKEEDQLVMVQNGDTKEGKRGKEEG